MTDFLNWTQAQLEEYMSKRGNSENRTDNEPTCGKESELQSKICKFLNNSGYYYFHDRSRGKNLPGHPDLVIALPGGRTLWIELKARGGRLSRDQHLVQMKLMYAKHEFYIVKSFKQFLSIVHRDMIDIKK